MKKFFIAAGLMVASALAFTNCNRIEEPKASDASNFSFTLAGDDTRTAAGEFGNLVWSENDAINVYHTVKGSDTCVSDGKFTANTASIEGNRAKFDGQISGLELGSTYTFYALYPYTAKKTTTTSQDGYIYIGHSKGANQQGLDSRAHVCGTLCPLAGKIEDVTVNTGNEVGIQMHHISSLIEFRIANGTGKDIVITKVTMTSTEDIVGSYYMDITDPLNVVLTPSGASYVNKTAVLNVLGGEIMAKNVVADFYLPIKPHTVNGDLKIEVSYTVEGQNVTATFTKTSNPTFKAGRIHRTNLEVTATTPDPEPDPETSGDVITRETTGVEDGSTAYTDWTATGESGAVYAGQSAGSNNSIQLRSKNDNSGVITKSSSKTLDCIRVTWNNTTAAGRILNVYGSNTGYSSPADLYASDANKVGEIAYSSASLTQTYTFTSDYTCFGLRSASGAAYIEKIEVVYKEGGSVPFEEHDGYFIYDNERYNTVALEDDGTWMAENLRFVPKGMSVTAPAASYEKGKKEAIYYPAAVYFNDDDTIKPCTGTDDAEVVKAQGLLYTPAVAMAGEAIPTTDFADCEKKQGICPPGWHIPTAQEWINLVGACATTARNNTSAPYYEASLSGASLEILNLDGFNFLPYPDVNGANGSYLSTYSNKNAERAYYRYVAMSYFASSTGRSATQSYAAMITNNATKSSVNVAYCNLTNGIAVRCKKD